LGGEPNAGNQGQKTKEKDSSHILVPEGLIVFLAEKRLTLKGVLFLFATFILYQMGRNPPLVRFIGIGLLG
jgi:hypothetical protein